jgi:simple sugar transport system ATP-binding protein
VARLTETTLEVRGGEILGVAGVEGGGQLELLRVLAGRLAPDRGTAARPTQLGFVPEDRQRDAVIPAWDLIENFALKDAGAATGLMPWADYRARADAGVRAQDVRTSGVTSTMAALSGGNQQKFVLARELEGKPAALIVENPTRGLDVRATAQVLDALREARNAGVAVVIHSSDLDELFTVSDRMVVCFAGTVRAVPVDRDAVGRAMVGLA